MSMLFTPPMEGRIQPPPSDITLNLAAREMERVTVPWQGNGPEIAVFETNLKLNAPRKDGATVKAYLLDRIKQRVREVKDEMGLLENGRTRAGSFMGVREENQNTYDGNLDWRKQLPGTVFNTSNFTLGDNNRYARLLCARERDDLLGTRPFFGAMTTEEGDPELTHDVEEFVQGRVELSNVPDSSREGIRVANIINEAILKTTYVKNVTTYVGPAEVMLDPRDPRVPLVTPRGDYIYRRDEFIQDPSAENIWRLKKDLSVQVQEGTIRYAKFPRLPQKLVHYDNVEAQTLDFRCFLCPLKVRATWMADINVHLLEKTVDDLRADYPNIDIANEYFQRRRGGSTGARQPKRSSGEDDDKASIVPGLDMVAVGEVYIRCDADGDGQAEEIMAVVDLTPGSEDIIFADYLGNHMSRRPFSVLPGVEKVPNRWHAIGVFTKMRSAALYVDGQFNRINEKDSQNAAITFYHEDASEEWRSGGTFAPGSRFPVRVRTGWDPRVPIAGRINLQADAQLGTELMHIRRVASDLEFAVLSGRDASAGNMNQGKTATGVMSVERDANVVSKDMEADIAKGLEDMLELAVELLLDHMRDTETFLRDGGKTLVTLNREEIRSLPRKVKLLLTKTRSAEMLTTNKEAEAIWIRYMRLSPYEQSVGRPLYLRQLKGLEIDDADELLPMVTKEEGLKWLQAQEAASNPPPPPSKSISTKYTDLARSEQVQILSSEGIKPASDVEIAKKQSSEAALEAIKKGNAAKPSAPAGEPVESAPVNAGGGDGLGVAA